MFRVGILTISDSSSRGQREDKAGPLIQEILNQMEGFKVEQTGVCPDDKAQISQTLINWADDLGLDLILTTGGTGLAPRDVTPEATVDVIDKEIPGIPEAMRLYGLKKTDRAMLSRAVAGFRGGCLIINLPGSPKAVREGLEAVGGILEHAILKIQGDTTPCGNP